MGGAKSTSTASSSTKRKGDGPAFYAVKVGFAPGIYQSWDDAKQQTLGFKGPVFKKFATLTEAEHFMKDEDPLAAKVQSSKYYGVQVGHVPGVYTEWPHVLQQVTGFKGGKQKRFDTWEEANAYVNKAQDNASPDNGTGTPISLQGHLHSTTPSVAESRKSTKKQKQNDGQAVPVTSGAYEPGLGPLPPDSEDGFDRTIRHGLPKGREVELKTQDELNLRKLHPTGDFEGPLRIYTDGASKGNGRLGAYAGFGIWFGPNDPRSVFSPSSSLMQHLVAYFYIEMIKDHSRAKSRQISEPNLLLYPAPSISYPSIEMQRFTLILTTP